MDAFAGTQLPVTPKVKANGTARYGFNMADYKSFVQGSLIHQSSTTYSLEGGPDALVGNSPPFTTFDFSTGTGLNNWHVEAYVENTFDKRGDLGRLSECGTSYCFANTRIYPVKPMNFGVKFGQKF